MAKYWLATFVPDPAMSARAVAQVAPADSAAGWAIEVIQEEQLGEFAVLLSRVDDVRAPKKLQCVVGFANGSKASSIWRDRGFPLIDAIIDNPDTKELHIRSACFLEPDEINYDAPLISIPGMTVVPPHGDHVDPPPAVYEQSQEAPDYAFPATWIRRRQVSWSPKRTDTITVTPPTLLLKVLSPRLPSLAPLKSGDVTPKAIWYGTMELPEWPPEFAYQPLQRVSRADEFGPPSFQFDDVEVLGFRLNLDELGVGDRTLLSQMVDRLNFHLDPLESEQHGSSPQVIRNAIPDFRYCPATSTILLELLRYGKMKLKGASPPLREQDYQSQHELLVRVLVGRVDEDTAQARDPVTFVPTIFVDNPWSKIIGRNVQGFDKWMADFCVLIDGQFKRLRPDGRLLVGSERPEELASIKEIRLVDTTGKELGNRVLVRLDCPFDNYENWDAFQPIDLSLLSNSSSLVPLRWRQDDFSNPTFRRSFARSAIPAALKQLRSVQVSPVGEKGLLEKWKAESTLIDGTFTAKGTPQIVVPDGIVTLRLCSEPTAPKTWRNLCSLFGIAEGDEKSISLITGNWYRMRCSLELTVRDGFN
jgi:hypothetical protein